MILTMYRTFTYSIEIPDDVLTWRERKNIEDSEILTAEQVEKVTAHLDKNDCWPRDGYEVNEELQLVYIPEAP